MSRFVKIARNREPGQRILSRFARQTVDMWTGTSQWHGDTADAFNCTVSRTVSSLFHSHNEQNHMTFVRHRHINRPSPLLWRFPVWQQDRRASSGALRVDNRIIFTDGQAPAPDKFLNAVWVVYGDAEIKPMGGRVISIKPEQLKNR